MKEKSAIRHSSFLIRNSPLHFVITAGPTREYLDPVRFLSNPSTGKMGFAVARAAAERGHDVTLIAGPVALKTPKGVKRVDVVSAREMLAESLRSLSSLVGGDLRARPSAVSLRSAVRNLKSTKDTLSCDCGRPGGLTLPMPVSTVFVSTAAVADWRPARCAAKKLKKSQMSDTLKLVRNPDILKTLARQVEKQVEGCGLKGKCEEKVKVKGEGEQRNVFNSTVQPSPSNIQPVHLVGFAAETNDMLAEASRKCREKGLSFIVANDVTQRGAGFGTDTNRVTFVFPDGTQRPLPLMSKLAVARRIVRACEGLGL